MRNTNRQPTFRWTNLIPAVLALPPHRLALAVCITVLAGSVGCETTNYLVRHDDKTKLSPINSLPSALSVIRESRDPSERRRAFEYLGDPKHVGNDEARRDEVAGILTLALAAEADTNLRIVLVRSLGSLGSARAVPGLEQAAADKDPTVRIAACKALAHTSAPEAAEKLESLLASDSNLDVRLAAADALGSVHTREAASALLAGLQDSDVALRYRCRQSLKEMTGTDHVSDVAAWREEIQTANFEQVAGHKKKLGIF